MSIVQSPATPITPNIVLVVLEGWSSDLIKSCGGYDGVTPNMERMISQGYFFNNCYASGYLSDQGMAAIFSAFPAQPKTSIIQEPNKYGHLPCINTELEKLGYHTSFLFGGQLSYGNIRSYMYFNGFDRIVEGKDFDSSIPQCKLGVADEYLYARQLEELAKEQEPFFAAMFTLSSHSPYDMPMEEVLHWGDKEKGYINSVYYADKCIQDFIEKAKTTSWYKNTLFVFVSDHGHRSPKNWVFYQPEYRKIPLLFYGEVIKPEYRGKIDTVVAAQTDLAATLLGQLDIEAGKYTYSKNLLNPSAQRHVFYSFDEGLCFIKPTGQLCWHVKDQRIDFEKTNTEAGKQELLQEGKAILQVLTKEYFSF
ncbi:MAG: LTA synthase family protein [Saprospiraceae bacterium]|nr:LTA synthase family protein [Saprospiraceae bacterium]